MNMHANTASHRPHGSDSAAPPRTLPDPTLHPCTPLTPTPTHLQRLAQVVVHL